MHRSLTALIGTTLVVLVAGCSFDRRPDTESAAKFERFPVYWLGDEFEGRELTSVTAEDWSTAAVLIYGTCEPSGTFEPSCRPPISIQIFPLCYHLDAVALPPRERRRTIRGAPVGTQDGAPVLLTRRTQIKVYRGEGTDPGIALRALKALRSLNTVSPVISATDPIPPPPPGVLIGTRLCTVPPDSSTPSPIASPATYPSCGTYRNRNTPATAVERRVNRCIVRASAEGRHAWAVAALTTIEGDPIVNYAFVRGARNVLVISDTTRDRFGVRTWRRFHCTGLVETGGRLGWRRCRTIGTGKPSWLTPIRLPR